MPSQSAFLARWGIPRATSGPKLSRRPSRSSNRSSARGRPPSRPSRCADSRLAAAYPAAAMNRDVVRRSLLAIALVVVAAEPFLFWNAFAGDAQVHLVFMENASHGRFFDFNPGERVSGETSP